MRVYAAVFDNPSNKNNSTITLLHIRLLNFAGRKTNKARKKAYCD
ncbi:MAG: hypothetical protein ACI936_002576 [Paraglaciecola sp.]|jgi:hypothetical protein